jgi:serine/threonine-protein kinase
MTSDPQDLVGRTIGGYVLDRLIGQGGFAWVFAGHGAPGGGPVALKVLKPRYAGDRQFESRFRNEARVAAELHHPNIVHIRDVQQADGFTFFTMDLYPASLGSRLAQHGPLPEEAVVRIAVDLTAGLTFAHAAGFVHRDIKVDNVLLREDGTAVVGDFGIARAVSGYISATGVNMTIGTPQYISPEQAQGQPLDGRSDLYSLGVTLYKALTGEAPFHSNDWFELARMHVEDKPPSPRKKRPGLSARFERVILKCLEKDPRNRYPDARALQEELRAIADAGRGTATFGVAPPRTSEFAALLRGQRGRPRWLLPALAVMVIAVVALVVVLIGR